MPLPTPGQPRKTQWTFLPLGSDSNVSGLLLDVSFQEGGDWRVVSEVRDAILREIMLMVDGIRGEFDNDDDDLRRRLITAMIEQYEKEREREEVEEEMRKIRMIKVGFSVFFFNYLYSLYPFLEVLTF